MEYDVAIIGGGPMGCFAGTDMSKNGLNVVILEKDKYPGDSTVCAGGMHRDVAHFISVPEGAIEKKLRGIRLNDAGRIKDWEFPKDVYYMVYRKNLDVLLARRAEENGVTLITQASVVDVQFNERTLTYLDVTNGNIEKIRAKAFVFADGAHSLSHKIFGTLGTLTHSPEFIGYECDLRADAHTMDKIEIVLDAERLPFGYFWIFPKSDHINVGVGHPNNIPLVPIPNLLKSFIESRIDLRNRTILRRQGGVIPMSMNPVIQKENCLVIGDAAGMVNPITGGGYVCGFLSAKKCSDVCKKVFQNDQYDPQKFRNYKSAIYSSGHFIAIRSMSLGLNFLMLIHRHTHRSFYPSLLRFYLSISHYLMRFIKVI